MFIAIEGSFGKFRIQSKSQSSISISPSFAVDVLISDFNKMNSFTYDLSHSSSFEFFAYDNLEK